MKTIVIANQKGGVGKTTTVINLSVALSQLGKKVLCVDLDPQANMTMGFGIAYPDELDFDIANCLEEQMNYKPASITNKEKTPPEAYMKKAFGVDFIPSSIGLVETENALVNIVSRERILKRFLEPFKPKYDFIIIDCLPSLNLLTLNALTASDEVIIPIQTQYFSVKGLELLLNSVMQVQKNMNPNLKIAGVLKTMVDKRSKFQRTAEKIVSDIYEEHIKIFDVSIPLSVKVSENQSKGLPIVGTKANKVSEAYEKLARELILNGI